METITGQAFESMPVNPAVMEAIAEEAFNFALKKPKMLTMEMIDQADPCHHHGCSVEEV